MLRKILKFGRTSTPKFRSVEGPVEIPAPSWADAEGFLDWKPLRSSALLAEDGLRLVHNLPEKGSPATLLALYHWPESHRAWELRVQMVQHQSSLGIGKRNGQRHQEVIGPFEVDVYESEEEITMVFATGEVSRHGTIEATIELRGLGLNDGRRFVESLFLADEDVQ